MGGVGDEGGVGSQFSVHFTASLCEVSWFDAPSKVTFIVHFLLFNQQNDGE